MSVNAKPSKHAERFSSMLARCREYTAADIDGLRSSPRLQQLVRGVIRGTEDQKVVDAFIVLYEDFLPLRLGGDLIFSILDDRVQAARNERPGAEAQAGTGGEAGDELAQAKELFAAIDADGSGELSLDEIIGSGFVDLLRDYYGVRELDELFSAAGGSDRSSESAALSFGRFVAAARKLGALEDAEALRMAVLENRERGERALKRRRKHGARYDEMLATFEQWREAGHESALIASVENERLRAVLEGCFVGARNDGMVTALRVLYEDYAPLRMGGDLIWKVVQRIVNRAAQSGITLAAGGAAPSTGAADGLFQQMNKPTAAADASSK